MRAKNIKDMPIIELPTDEYHNILETKLFNYNGSEGIICKSDQADTLYKFFRRGGNAMPDNKVNKIRRLHIMNLNYMVYPLSLISVGGTIVGYEMTYDQSFVTLSDADLEIDKRIAALELSADALQYFHSRGVIHGDVRGPNILVNPVTGKIEYCDIDNTRTGLFQPIDLKSKSLHHFLSKGGKIGSVDAFEHNILAMQQVAFNRACFFDETYQLILAGAYPSDGFTPEAIPIFESMRNPKKFKGQYAIQYVKK